MIDCKEVLISSELIDTLIRDNSPSEDLPQVRVWLLAGLMNPAPSEYLHNAAHVLKPSHTPAPGELNGQCMAQTYALRGTRGDFASISQCEVA